MAALGFVVTRHVRSATTNRYWNRCVQCIARVYPECPVVVIDDHSDPAFVSAEAEYPHVTVVPSPYPRRGELLPFVMYVTHRWWPQAVFLHDSVFVHRRVPLQSVLPVMPLWHHEKDQEDGSRVLQVASALLSSTSGRIVRRLRPEPDELRLSWRKDGEPPSTWYALCFGAQCIVTLAFVQHLEATYGLSRLVQVVTTRRDRCAWERVAGALFWEESPALRRLRTPSLFGDIVTKPRAFQYTFDDYERDVAAQALFPPFVKVWTGR
jgi:hypothetical protein